MTRPSATAPSDRAPDLGVVAAFAVLTALPFLGKAFNIDEPFHLAVARHILRDPLHPTAFTFDSFGRLDPAAGLLTQSTLMDYLLAPAVALTGGVEWALRLCMLPFDLCAAAGLYLVASRFLRRPLWPSLIVLASPAYLINTPLLMGEKWIQAFGYAGLYAWLAWADGEGERWSWAAAALLGLAFLAKYSAVFLAPPAAFYAFRRGAGVRRAAWRLAAAAAPSAAYLAWGALFEPQRLGAIAHVAAQAAQAQWAYKLRSLLAFIGGCGAVTAVWPFLLPEGGRRSRFAWTASALGAAAFLFSPVFDGGPMSLSGRLTGVLFSSGAILAFKFLLRAPGAKLAGWELWAPWALSVLLLSAGVYWSIVSHFILFLVPPLVFSMAAFLESRRPSRSLEWFYGTSLAGSLALSLCLARADARYASAQKQLAEHVGRTFVSRGRNVWYTGHWGFQYYMEKAGARALRAADASWTQVRPGDLVVAPSINANILQPLEPIPARITEFRVVSSLPLRLMGEGAGFYGNGAGVLPFCFSRAPLDVFRVYERL